MNEQRILMVGNHPSVKGGITSVIEQLLSYDWKSDGIGMLFVPTYINGKPIKKILFFLKAYHRIRKILRKHEVSAVYMHMSYRGSFVRKYLLHKLCMKYGIRDIIHLHGSEFQKWYNTLPRSTKTKVRKLLKDAHSCIVLGEKWNKIIKDIEPAANIVVVQNAVHIPSEIAHWDDNFRVLFLGVLIKRKGVSDLLMAVKMLKESHNATKLCFVIAGTGEEEEFLKKQVNDLQISDMVIFAGWTTGEKKKHLLQKSQMFVLPSYNEGLPVAVLEAISYGLPVVATDVGDMSSAVVNGQNGFLIQPGDIVALKDNIEKISTDKNLYEKMSHASRYLAEQKFSDEEYFNKIKLAIL